MFGGGLNVPVPDIDRTDHLLMLGANPYASNGSLATAPDWPGRIEALVERGGTVVVVDPRRSAPPRWPASGCPSAPAPTPYLLMAMVQVITSEGLVDLGAVRRPRHRPRRGASRRRRRSRPRRSHPPPASTPS